MKSIEIYEGNLSSVFMSIFPESFSLKFFPANIKYLSLNTGRDNYLVQEIHNQVWSLLKHMENITNSEWKSNYSDLGQFLMDTDDKTYIFSVKRNGESFDLKLVEKNNDNINVKVEKSLKFGENLNFNDFSDVLFNSSFKI